MKRGRLGLLRGAAIAIATLAAVPAQAGPDAARWNLGAVYAAAADWDADAAHLNAQLADLAACKGHL
ncbi:MAG: hypothetical protein ACREXI_00620, partial [Caldimonas sp.]